MGVETVSLVIAAFVNASLAMAALLRNIRSRLCVAFASWAGLLFFHDALSVLEKFQTSPWVSSTIGHTLSVLLAGPATLWVLREIVPRQGASLRRILWGYVPLCLVFFLVMALGSYERLGPLILIVAHLIYLFPAGLWLVVLGQAASRSTLTREKIRLRYAFVGAAVTVAFFVTDVLFIAGTGVPPLGTLARTLYLYFIFHTFIQKELMTAEEVVAKTALFSGIGLMLSTIFLILVSWVGDQRDLFFFNTLIASVVIVVLFEPIRQFTLWATRKLFLRKNFLIEQELNRLSEALRGIVEPAELARRLGIALRRSLGVEKCTVHVLDRDGLSFVAFDADGGVPQESGEEAVTGPLVEYMTLRRGRPFVLESVENDRDSFHSERARRFCEDCLESMRKLKADIILPFTHEARVVGFASAKGAETTALSNEQLRLFIPIARQLGLHLRNAHQLVTLSERNKLAAVGEMAAGLAHEIKNPLGAIKGAAQLLASQPGASEPGTAEFLKIIVDETDRLSGVLSDFLDYAKPRRNLPQGCNALRVVEHAAALGLGDSRLRLEIEGSADAWLEADPDGLKQVLLNLILNAADATADLPDGAVKVRVRVLRPTWLPPFADRLPLYKVWEGWQAMKLPVRRGLVEIEVADNGVGIPPADLGKIFTPFFTTKPKGTGLGLAICQRVIEAMGGTIAVRANHPRGSVFSIHLPLRDEGAQETPKVRMKEVPA